MSEIVLKIEGLYKQYRLGVIGATTLRDDIARAWSRFRGKEDPTYSLERKTSASNNELVWALNDISLEVNRGDIVGVIGKNGAGKSTLLKILSKVTAPTKGEVKVKGRVASLLEVGTGFHPELTGRENIFLNGAILGMAKSEIRSKLDEIIDFAGVEKYIDTPVKRYSSGMYVRLAFGVAAHLEPDILIVDEVLAVGDAEFQKKCLGKMGEATRDGRTVLFVSHQMAALKQLCSRAILLSNGVKKFDGNVSDAIEIYLNENSNTDFNKAELYWTELDSAPGSKEMHFTSMRLLNDREEAVTDFDIGKKVIIEIGYEVHLSISNLRFGIHLLGPDQAYAFVAAHIVENAEPGNYIVRCIIPENLLNVSSYEVIAGAGVAGVIDFTPTQSYFKFTTYDLNKTGMILSEKWPGLVKPKLNWELGKK